MTKTNFNKTPGPHTHTPTQGQTNTNISIVRLHSPVHVPSTVTLNNASDYQANGLLSDRTIGVSE